MAFGSQMLPNDFRIRCLYRLFQFFVAENCVGLDYFFIFRLKKLGTESV